MATKSKCIFCLSTKGQFTSKEHIIPESLSGDALLPRGFVCDSCNSYFGSKIEHEVLTYSPLGFARAFLAIPTKKGRGPWYKGFRFEIQGSIDGRPIIEMHPEKLWATVDRGRGRFLVPDFGKGSIVRLLLKMGLGFIAKSGKLDVFDSRFDKAREAARFAKMNQKWSLAETHLDLNHKDVRKTGKDEKGLYEKRTIHSYYVSPSPKDNLVSVVPQLSEP